MTCGSVLSCHCRQEVWRGLTAVSFLSVAASDEPNPSRRDSRAIGQGTIAAVVDSPRVDDISGRSEQ